MTIPGTDLSDEIVVIGGHLDSITFSGSNAPGADDDASGIATLTEVARLILTQDVPLRRTVQFMAYAGEEAGLRGSDAIADDYAARDVPVVGVMQLDMTNYDGSQFDIVLITDNTDDAQTNFLGDLAATYLPQFPVSSDDCGYACSDHASWSRNGFPAVLPFEATMSTYNPTIHSPNDTLAVSGNNANHASKFAKLAVAYIVEMAEVPGDDEPPPPPTGAIRLAQVAYDVPGLDRLGEFVDLENTSAAAVSLDGYRLSNGVSTWSFPAGATIPAGGFASVAASASGFTSLYGQAPEISGVSITLSNSAGELFLLDGSGAEVDHVGWERSGWPLYAATGQSIVRTAAEDSDTFMDWVVSRTTTPR
jgi:leucyl aminopeptidase